MPSVPHSIDAALLALGRPTGLSSVLRALENAVDRALSAAFERSPANRSDIAKALEMVRRCMDFAQSESGGRGDLAELPQLERLSALLEAQLAPDFGDARALATVLPSPQQASLEVAKKVAPSEPRPFATLRRPHRTSEIVSSVLSSLATLYSRRQHLLDDLLSPWRDFRDVDRKIQDAVWSVSWFGDAALGPARAALSAAEDDAERFSAALTLLCAGDADFIFSLVFERSAFQPGGEAGPLLALRMGGDASLAARAEASIATPSLDVRKWGLSTLAEGGRLSADTLVGLLDDPSDDIAGRAAELLAWVGRSPSDSGTIEARLRHGVSEGRRCSFLYAAVALGSVEALQEVRRMMDEGETVTACAIDALAVAGSESDSERLLSLAAREEPLGPLAVLAAGHLGNPIGAKAFPTAAGDRARQTILGHADSAVAPGQNSRRLLYGHPWTLSAALARLADPDELVRSRQWYALEVAVRTGVRPLVVFDATARVALQDSAAARIRNAIETRRRPVPDGSWFYFGQRLG